MRFAKCKIVVSDLLQSEIFYEDILKQSVRYFNQDYVVYNSGLCLYSERYWNDILNSSESIVNYYGNDASLYFEETDFDLFILDLESRENINFINHATRLPDGQRVVRFYDLDYHIIEVGESKRYESGFELEKQTALVNTDINTSSETLLYSLKLDFDSMSRNEY